VWLLGLHGVLGLREVRRLGLREVRRLGLREVRRLGLHGVLGLREVRRLGLHGVLGLREVWLLGLRKVRLGGMEQGLREALGLLRIAMLKLPQQVHPQAHPLLLVLHICAQSLQLIHWVLLLQ
jgi:hypothetical protein